MSSMTLQQELDQMQVSVVNPFENCIRLAHEAIFYVPSTDNVSSLDLALQKAILEELETELSLVYGGCTEMPPCSGKWVSASGLVTETVIPVQVFVSDIVLASTHLVQLARWIKERMHQEFVLLVVDGEGFLV